MIVFVPELPLMLSTRKTHWFRKDTEFWLESENMPDIIEEATVILDVAVIFLACEERQCQRISFLSHNNRNWNTDSCRTMKSFDAKTQVFL